MQRRKRRPTSYDVFHENLRLQGFRDYNDYLHSETWRRFNELYRQSQLPQKCLACGFPEFILHHWTYERVTFENLSDVIPLCAKCHEKLHRWLLQHKEIELRWVRQQLRQCFGKGRREADKAFAPFLAMERKLAAVKSRPIQRACQSRPNTPPKKPEIKVKPFEFVCKKCGKKTTVTKQSRMPVDGECYRCINKIPAKQKAPKGPSKAEIRRANRPVPLAKQMRLDHEVYLKNLNTPSH